MIKDNEDGVRNVTRRGKYAFLRSKHDGGQEIRSGYKDLQSIPSAKVNTNSDAVHGDVIGEKGTRKYQRCSENSIARSKGTR